ncbi:hypothetical protein NDU88_006754 [Pleurodeles waltl]|uniref:Uncharacterized protein n=1 Tax=Pleurodeles waltl TaxID=8319 RepID=A0AAV7TY31_PLEWA|nr:hypothetical protein NDU88_006754 [Pleurodeles waltl]
MGAEGGQERRTPGGSTSGMKSLRINSLRASAPSEDGARGGVRGGEDEKERWVEVDAERQLRRREMASDCGDADLKFLETLACRRRVMLAGQASALLTGAEEDKAVRVKCVCATVTAYSQCSPVLSGCLNI